MSETIVYESEEKSELAQRAPAPLAVQVPSIESILARAVESGMTPESLDKIVNLYHKVQDRAAAQEFNAAMAQFQAECPPIQKRSTASITTNSGSNYSYTYAELDEIANTVRPLLHKHGLSYSWDMVEEGGRITCTCSVRHANGHAVTAKFVCAIDTSARMSGPQKSAAALTYARRQSLVQALGLTTCDKDTDAPAHRGPPDNGAKISEHDAANMEAALDELNANRSAFLKMFNVEKIADLPASRVKEAWAKIETKRQKEKEAAR